MHPARIISGRVPTSLSLAREPMRIYLIKHIEETIFHGHRSKAGHSFRGGETHW